MQAELPGQTVQGELIERVTWTPVEGAFVLLVDAQGAEVSRALTNRDGRFTVRAAIPGVYKLVAKRVGFRPTQSLSLTLQQDRTLSHQLVLDAIPVDLATVVVEGEQQCDMRSERRGAALAALWEEIREALASVVWTAREPGYWFEFTVFERDLTAGRRVLRETSTSRAGYYRTPFASAPARQLSERGYVVADGDQWAYFAPDAEALLSDSFLKTHCFEVRVGKGDNAGHFGVSFSPAPGNEVPDISGTLWVDRETTELRHLEYAYVQLPRALAGVGGGGRISFRRVPSGAWIVDDWVIRMPLLDPYRVPNPTGSTRVREAGGHVLVIKRGDGTIIHSGAVATIEGTVFDSVLGEGLRDAQVSLVGTGYTTRTDAAGRFQLAALLEGRYGLIFEHARLDSLAFRPEQFDVDLRPGVVTSVRLGVPSDPSLVARLCPDTIVPSTERVVVGVLREQPSGRPMPDAEIVVTWQEVRSVPGRVVAAMDWRASGRTDGSGSYTVCALPLDRTITFVGRIGRHEGTPVQLRFVDGGLLVDNARFQTWLARIWKQDLHVPTGGEPFRPPDAVVSNAPTATLDTASAVLEAVGFYERRRTGMGRFITREEFARWSPASVSSVLVRIPGLRATVRGSRRIIDIRRGRASLRLDCTPAVVLDDSHIGSTAEIDVDALVPIEQVAGIEVYTGASQTPARFGVTGTACGLIAVWTGR